MIRRLHERWRAYTRRRRALLVGGLSLAAIVTVALVMVGLARVPPAWWHPVDGASADVGARAEKLENAMMGHVSLVRPRASGPTRPGVSFQSEDWRLSLRSEDANAWLAARLGLWLEHRGADRGVRTQFESVQVQFGEQRLRMGALLMKDGREQVVGVSARPVVRSDGSLWFEEPIIEAGRLSVPASWAAGFLRARAERYLPAAMREQPAGRELLEIMAGERPALREAVLRLEDGRRVRLLAITPREGRVEFLCRTEKR
ncbi:MAG: hypothetical protein ACOYN0_02505 [Phycisphaerales bacterium]